MGNLTTIYPCLPDGKSSPNILQSAKNPSEVSMDFPIIFSIKIFATRAFLAISRLHSAYLRLYLLIVWQARWPWNISKVWRIGGVKLKHFGCNLCTTSWRHFGLRDADKGRFYGIYKWRCAMIYDSQELLKWVYSSTASNQNLLLVMGSLIHRSLFQQQDLLTVSWAVLKWTSQVGMDFWSDLHQTKNFSYMVCF